jgi:hypothetical protein
VADPHAVGKVMAEKLVNAGRLEQALGKSLREDLVPNQGNHLQRLGGEHLPLHFPPGDGEEEGSRGCAMNV